ncbi:MAG: 8-oxo-dGTP diphosphatase MutT [Caldisericaceae bacterium]|nr:8-oxo-dGTP diphosphatase MutT [Caldisericaceae bacterium]
MKDKPKINVVAAVIVNQHNRILITQRPPDSHLSGYWEFPGGKIDEDERPEQALKREIKEELNVEVEILRLLWQQDFEYPQKKIQISFYHCRLLSDEGQIKPLEVADFRWIFVAEFPQFNFPPADAAFIKKLTKNFKSLVE